MASVFIPVFFPVITRASVFFSHLDRCQQKPTTFDCFRAATNVRTFEYYSFEIFTNESFYERTFVDARWSIFGSLIAERSFGLGCESHTCMALLLKSCADACHVPESSRERSGNMNFQLEEKHERQSFSSFKHLLSGGNLKQFGCFYARHHVLWPQSSSGR